MQYLRIGELAKRTSITIRTLHYYDEIGLLQPSYRNDAGHRFYTTTDVAKLQKILSLKSMGFSLQDTMACLDGEDCSITHILGLHLKALSQELEHKHLLFKRLEQLFERLNRQENPSIDDFIKSCEVTVMFEKYYTQDQLDYLAQRREQLGEDVINNYGNQWKSLFAEFQEKHKAGLSSSHAEVIALGKKGNELRALFHGNNPSIIASQQKMMAEQTPEALMKLWGLEDYGVELFYYSSEAMENAK